MDKLQDYAQDLLALSDKRMALATKYASERKAYGELKAELDLIYAASILRLMEKKKNLGYETGVLCLLGEKPELADIYKPMIEHYNNYKAIERMLDSYDGRITAIQSIMRYCRENDGGLS